MKSKDDVVEWQLAEVDQNTRIGVGMTDGEAKMIKQVLTDNKDLFTWTVEDMLGIDPRVMCHKLSICREARPVA